MRKRPKYVGGTPHDSDHGFITSEIPRRSKAGSGFVTSAGGDTTIFTFKMVELYMSAKNLVVWTPDGTTLTPPHGIEIRQGATLVWPFDRSRAQMFTGGAVPDFSGLIGTENRLPAPIPIGLWIKPGFEYSVVVTGVAVATELGAAIEFYEYPPYRWEYEDQPG